MNHFLNSFEIKYYILVKYYSTLQLNIENVLHEYFKNKKKNEIELYYLNRYQKNMEYIIYNLVIIKNMKNVLGEISGQEIPFQFFHFS